MKMKRFLTAVATFSLVEWVGRHAVLAGSLMLMGIGGGIIAGSLITPSIVPQASAYFNQNQTFGNVASGLLPNGGTGGAFFVPATDVANSIVIPFELMVDPHLLNGAAVEAALGSSNSGSGSGLILGGNGQAKPAFIYKNLFGGGANYWWNEASALTVTATPPVSGTSTYNNGLYTGTATGGGCKVEPGIAVQGGTGVVAATTPGFDCTGWVSGAASAVSVSDVSMVGFGARQVTGGGGATTCALVNSNAVVTANVPVAHGLTPGMTYTMQGFGAGFTGYNTNYTALQGTTGTTLVGSPTSHASCPTSPVTGGNEGTALSGTGASMAFPAVSLTNPYGNASLGITTNNGAHICGVIVENGDDSAFPGLAAISMVDQAGAPLDGSPRIAQNLNQGRADFNGYTVNVTQATGPTPALNVTSMIPTTITAATYSFAGDLAGSIRFTTSATSLIPGSEFTVSGASPSAVNITYVALAGTVPGGTVVVGNPLSGPNGVLQPISNPGAITFSSGQYVDVIMPGMQLFGVTQNLNVAISPFGTFGGTGTGGVGSYGLTGNLSSLSLTGSITAGPSGTLSITAGIGFGLVTIGTDLAFNNGSPQTARITGYGTTGAGGNGNYTTDWAGGAFSSGPITASTIGDIGSPAKILTFSGYYYTGVPVASSPNVTMTKRTQASFTDFVNPIGAAATTITPFTTRGWGGAIGNVGMLYGKFPMASDSTPSTTALASLCTKTTTIQAFAAANGLTVNSLYELNDVGIFGDSSWADFHGHTAGSTLTVDSTEAGSLPAFSGSYSIRFSGPGLPVGGVLATAGSAGGPYTLASSVGTIAIESMKAGRFAPATPIASSTATGYIDGANILHVTALPTGTGNASFTGQLTSEWTGQMAITTGVLTINSLQTGAISVAGVGTIVNSAPGAATTFGPCTITSLGTGTGGTGTYNTNCTPVSAIGAELMDGSGPLPAGPTTLNVSSVTGTIQVGSVLTDGGVNLTGGQPPIVTAVLVSGSKYSVLGNYFPAVASEAMISSFSTIVPGEYITNAALTTPVKIVAFQPGACANVTTAAILNGGLGCYSLSNSANGTAGSSFGSPLTLIGTTITDGGAIAPGPALTISDPGPQVTFPVTNYGSGTGFLSLLGTYDVPTLGGTPSAIQVLVSNYVGGPALSGCTPCNWGTLTGTISGGAWSGSISGIPAGGPYTISVRAANGTAYVTLPSTIRIGVATDMWGEGQNTWVSTTGGTFLPYFSGLWSITGLTSGGTTTNGFSQGFLTTPIANNMLAGYAVAVAGDRFGAGSTLLPEGVGFYEQGLSNTFGGWPVNTLIWLRDGIGAQPFTTGNVIQTETIDVGDGTKKVWCSQATLCPGSSGGTLGREGLLGYNAATLTGAWFAGSVAGNTPTGLSTVTIGTYVGGAVEPGMILSGAGISGTPKLLYCTSCPSVTSANVPPIPGTPQSSTWVIDTNLGTISSENMRVDPTSAMVPYGLSSTPMPTYNLQSSGSGGSTGICCSLGGFGAYIIKTGTFQLLDTDPTTHVASVICTDPAQASPYGITGGTCPAPGVISSSFVNYLTGDYQFTFTSAPATGHVITAQWVNISSPETLAAIASSRPSNLDFFGDGTSQSGPVSSVMAKAPGGVSAHIFIEPSSDINALGVASGVSGFKGYQFGGPGYASQLSWYYATRFPNTAPGETSTTPLVMVGASRSEGPSSFSTGATGYQQLGYITQLAEDMTTSSTFSGSIASNVLTLSADSVGAMWEGEVIGGGNLLGANGSSGTGVFITGLTAGAWGKNGSTYSVSGMSAYNPGGTATGAFFNDVFYKGGNGIFGGSLADVSTQAKSAGATVTSGSGHMDNGFAGGPRNGRRFASAIAKGLINPNVPNEPTLDRTKASATGCDAASLANPCLDVGATFQASHAATWSTGGNVFTVTGGLAAHARPFVVGQSVACSSCNAGLVITSVSLPPTQDTRTGAGQVGQTFTFTVANASAQAIGGSGSGTVTAGCSGTSGTGSNCIDMAFVVNATGTFGTAKALATCGENNLNGNSPPYVLPSGVCQDTGVGTLIRTFRIGTTPNMSDSSSTGSLFDDGVDFAGGLFTQNGAFTCNIVAAVVVQCVKAPVLGSNGLLSSFGQWASGSTFVSYGDVAVVTGRQGSMLGPVGGSSLPFSGGGTGYSNGQVAASCPSIQSGGFVPVYDIKTSGGVITDVYPSSTVSASGSHQPTGLGVIAAGCTVTPPTGTGFNSSGSITIAYAPLEGLPGIATYNTDTNEMGLFLNDNGGFPGNPSNVFYTNGQGGYFEPGDGVRPFGQFQGVAVFDSAVSGAVLPCFVDLPSICPGGLN